MGKPRSMSREDFLYNTLKKKDVFKMTGGSTVEAIALGILGAAAAGAIGVGIGAATGQPNLGLMTGLPLASLGGCLALTASNDTGYSNWESNLNSQLSDKGYKPLSKSETKSFRKVYDMVNGNNSDYMPLMFAF